MEIDRQLAAERLNKREKNDLGRSHIEESTIELSTQMWQKSEDEYIKEFHPSEQADIVHLNS